MQACYRGVLVCLWLPAVVCTPFSPGPTLPVASLSSHLSVIDILPTLCAPAAASTAAPAAASTAARGAALCRFVYHLGLLSYVADSAVRAAAGCLEWLSDELQREFNAASINPLACRYEGGRGGLRTVKAQRS